MNLIEQICCVRQYMMECSYQSGYADAVELWLPVYDDNDEVVGIERISDNDGNC